MRDWIFLVLLWIVPSAMAAGHAVMWKRDSRSALNWLFVSGLVPVAGPLSYVLFGVNRIRRRAIRWRAAREGLPDQAPGLSQNLHAEPILVDAEHLQPLQRVGARVTGLPLLGGNRVTPLWNGNQAYPVMLEAIDGATTSITLSSYIFDWDAIGRRFTSALAAAARRGVRVHVLLDGLGAGPSRSPMARELKQHGAEVVTFFPFSFPLGRLRINLRNHRKILVIDGKRGFTGGMNISKRHLIRKDTRDAQSEDLHFDVRGPVVAELQRTNVEDWYLATERVLEGEEYFPALSAEGRSIARGVASGPDGQIETMHVLIEAALASARSSVRIVTPYFVPTPRLIGALIIAAVRGVAVTVLVPERTDIPFVQWASNAHLWQVVQHGVRVAWRRPPFVHTKLMIVDDHWLTVGSTNLDARSLRLNFEFNLEIYDPELAAPLSRWFDHQFAGAVPATMGRLDARGPGIRLRDGVARLFAPLL